MGRWFTSCCSGTGFYVDTTEFWRVFIDGLFHLGSALLLFVGALQLWRQRKRLADLQDGGAALGAGVLLGMGAFNLYDGVVQHKLLRFHPVRLGVDNQLPLRPRLERRRPPAVAYGLGFMARSEATGSCVPDPFERVDLD